MRGWFRITFGVASALLVVTSVAGAHEFWLSPSRYRVAAGDTLTLDARVGTAFRGESSPFATTRTERFVLRGAHEHDLSRAGVNGALQWARWIAGDPGGEIVAFESGFKGIELPPDRFDDYLRLEGLDGPLAARARLGKQAGPGRERFARCAKTWIRGSDPSRAVRPVGMTLELVPLEAPGSSVQTSVRLLWQGKPLQGALLRAWVRPLAAGQAPMPEANRDSVTAIYATRTASDGTARVPTVTAGEWMFSAVHMIPSADRTSADWDSYWASLTFAR